MKSNCLLLAMFGMLLTIASPAKATATNEQIFRAFLPTGSLLYSVENSLKAVPHLKLRDKFSQLGSVNACKLYKETFWRSVHKNSGKWNEAVYRAVRATVPDDVIIQAANAPAFKSGYITDPYTDRIQAAISQDADARSALVAIMTEVGETMIEAAKPFQGVKQLPAEEAQIDALFASGLVVNRCKS